jgi:feruloyl esterase
MNRTCVKGALAAVAVAGCALASPWAGAAMPGCSLAALPAISGVTYKSATDNAATATAPEYCRVIGNVASPAGNPNGDGFAVDLPASWNGRFLMGGGGGFTGSLNGPNITALSAGFAVSTTDTGHTGGVASFALTAPGVPATGAIIDYFYLAMHTVTAMSKQLIKDFYGTADIKYSYFQGCSTGGRQALMEAERYPDDFDGIIAGDAFMTHRLVLQQYKGEFDLLQPPAAYITPAQLTTIDAAVYANCDAKDGVKDNLIQNPQACSFKPSQLLCKGSSVPPACLTAAQVDALSDYIAPIKRGKELVIAGYPISDLGGSDGMALWFLGSTPTNFAGPEPWASAPFSWGFADQTLKDFVYVDPGYNIFNFDLNTEGQIGAAALALYDQKTEAGNADSAKAVNAYLAKGKKLLIYHGFSDGGLTPYPMIRFYKGLADEKGGYENLQRGARLFLVPGMHHCGGGPGPNVFDTLTPLQAWVEKGTPPDGIIASHTNATTKAIDRTMPLCKFPEKAKYSGSGDVNLAANWSCPSDDRSLLKIGPNGFQAGLGGQDDDEGEGGDD